MVRDDNNLFTSSRSHDDGGIMPVAQPDLSYTSACALNASISALLGPPTFSAIFVANSTMSGPSAWLVALP